MDGLTTQGIVFITLGWGSVGGLMIYCMIKVLSGDDNMEA